MTFRKQTATIDASLIWARCSRGCRLDAAGAGEGRLVFRSSSSASDAAAAASAPPAAAAVPILGGEKRPQIGAGFRPQIEAGFRPRLIIYN